MKPDSTSHPAQEGWYGEDSQSRSRRPKRQRSRYLDGVFTEALGMEIMAHNTERQMAFLSFGTQHHDIALCQAPAGAERGVLGIIHIAMQIEGGAEELSQLYGRLLKAGAQIDRTTEHSTLSFA